MLLNNKMKVICTIVRIEQQPLREKNAEKQSKQNDIQISLKI